MNVNKTIPAFLLCLSTLLTSPFPVLAQQGSAPALYNVKELLIQHGRLANQQASANCGTSSGEIAAMVLKAFKTDGLPAIPVLGAPPADSNTARVEVFPDVATLQPREKECISWVSLTVQSKDLLLIRPIETPRNLITTYWTGGLMVSSSTTAHPVSINDAVTKLTAAFSRQYRLDQPASLASPTSVNIKGSR